MEIPAVLLVFWIVAVNTEEVDWMSQCNKCKCTWSEGKKTATCSNTNLNSIPMDLSPEIRVIDFSNNPIYALQKKVFTSANLRDIHKLWLSNCTIDYVHKTAFSGLSLLIELDLSKNLISKLDKDVFADNKKLRILNLSHNRIKALEDDLFYNMTHLQRILLSHNEISSIGDDAFVMLDTLQTLDLGYNQLKTVSFDFTSRLKKLNSLYVEENPWICDCHLNAFREKTISNNLITKPTECAEPEHLRGRTWMDHTIIFACVPQIIEPLPSTQIEATSSNVTLSCKVSGEPQPDVDWVTNGRIVDKDPRQNTQRFFTSKRKSGEYTWNNLTIVNVNYRDKGEYKCIAKNPGGTDEQNITLLVSYYEGGVSTPYALNAWVTLIIGLSCGAVIILLVILILVCCCYKKKTHGMAMKRRDMTQTSDEYIGLHGQPEIEKALITDVNPVIKPPRATMPNSVTSGGTEVSETKKNLLDNDSVFTNDEESRSLDLENHYYKKPPNPLDTDYRGHPYPPDLLSFPPRAQVSPAASSASTVADTSRLPAHHGPQSPMHSPLYDQINLYRTLPYSRSQSPFIGSNARVPRQGYVTIPRRPRQSWSSEPPTLSDIGEPLYDNLGLRTTADGASALSLNKIGETPTASTPRSNRMFPLSPSFCDPISEQESPPTATTLPRNTGSHKLSPSRTDWARANAEALRSPEKRSSVSSMPPLPPTPERKVAKIPPRPPPKPPKKRVSTGPLFEDEGEDGTEV